MAVYDYPTLCKELTEFKFVGFVQKFDGQFVDMEDEVYSRWYLYSKERDVGVMLVALETTSGRFKKISDIQEGQEYVITNGNFVAELGVAIFLDNDPFDIILVLTTKSKIAKATEKDSKGVVPLKQLVDRALTPRFRGIVKGKSEIDAEWDPDSPQFVVRIADDAGNMRDFHGEGTNYVREVYPLVKPGNEVVFVGGQWKMDYKADTLRLVFKDETRAILLREAEPVNAK